eukprot:CAMPEP_0172768686 /NCGR_PEP_ID=MMETSP1074-20121228/185259_1 /TAXON_ID=2916 /ORGANISM="Ceratium fusus, Strain PA161109" /LENGTH=134 /DNA_ID=CAMNT_0013604129 /DNA_START=59 /DNA_END=463 /DNA_ORIENTATION=-
MERGSSHEAPQPFTAQFLPRWCAVQTQGVLVNDDLLPALVNWPKYALLGPRVLHMRRLPPCPPFLRGRVRLSHWVTQADYVSEDAFPLEVVFHGETKHDSVFVLTMVLVPAVLLIAIRNQVRKSSAAAAPTPQP